METGLEAWKIEKIKEVDQRLLIDTDTTKDIWVKIMISRSILNIDGARLTAAATRSVCEWAWEQASYIKEQMVEHGIPPDYIISYIKGFRPDGNKIMGDITVLCPPWCAIPPLIPKPLPLDEMLIKQRGVDGENVVDVRSSLI